MFEKALKQQLEKELKHPVNEAYREYIEASLQDLSACHGGYFANDNDSSDEEVARETKEILHDKWHCYPSSTKTEVTIHGGSYFTMGTERRLG